MNATNYPLSWPLGWARTEPSERDHSRFGKYNARPTITQGCNQVLDELERMGIGEDLIVVSTNLREKPNGMPYSRQPDLDDPGIAVYWESDDGEHVLACDRYRNPGCNLRAIVKHIEALRGISRWGCGSLEQAFSGYMALPAETGGEAWWETLGLDGPAKDPATIKAAFRDRAMDCHPDRGGEREDWDALQVAAKQGFEFAAG